MADALIVRRGGGSSNVEVIREGVATTTIGKFYIDSSYNFAETNCTWTTEGQVQAGDFMAVYDDTGVYCGGFYIYGMFGTNTYKIVGTGNDQYVNTGDIIRVYRFI